MIHLLFHVVTYRASVPAAQHLASEPDVSRAVLGKGRRKIGGVAVALVFGVTLHIVSDDPAKRSIGAAEPTASDPDRTVAILEDALDAAPLRGQSERLAVLEAVYAVIGGHPQ